MFDSKACFLSLPKFVKYNRPESPNVIKAWAGALDLLPECRLKSELIQNVKDLVEGLGEGFQKAFAEAFPKGIGNPEQEQEQEQEQELEQEPKQEPEPDKHTEVLFNRFWMAYPRKESKVAAQQAFKKIKANGTTAESMLLWLEDAKQSEQWQDLSKVPHPSTCLNQRRWESNPPSLAKQETRLSVEERLRMAHQEEMRHDTS